LSVVFDAAHGAHIHRPSNIGLFALIRWLVVHKVVGRVIAVHEILQSVGKADSASVAFVSDVEFPRGVFFKSDCRCVHDLILQKFAEMGASYMPLREGLDIHGNRFFGKK